MWGGIGRGGLFVGGGRLFECEVAGEGGDVPEEQEGGVDDGHASDGDDEGHGEEDGGGDEAGDSIAEGGADGEQEEGGECGGECGGESDGEFILAERGHGGGLEPMDERWFLQAGLIAVDGDDPLAGLEHDL